MNKEMPPHNGNTINRESDDNSPQKQQPTSEVVKQQQPQQQQQHAAPKGGGGGGGRNNNRFAYLYDGVHKRRRAVSGQLSRKERRWELLLSKVPRSTTHYEPEPFVFRVRDYIVIERLGAGSGGRVYLGRHDKTGERVAIKVIEKVDARKERKARKEAGVMRALSKCKHIVPLIDVAENEGSVCIVMGHAEGGDLFEHIGRNGALEPAKAWRIFGQIVRAVAYAHSCGFIHRDVKPENIFLDKDGNAMLGDWGYAAAWSSWKKKRRPCGSLNYAASEIVSNKTYTGPEVDIFSLGGCLYTMLTGRLPFGSAVNRATLQRVIAGKWRHDSTLSPDVVDMLNRMFDPVPIRRATMMEVIQFVRSQQQKYCVTVSSDSPLCPSSPESSFERDIRSDSCSDIDEDGKERPRCKQATGGVMKMDLTPVLRKASIDTRNDRQLREQLAAKRVESPRESSSCTATTPPSPDPSETCSRASKKPIHDTEHIETDDELLTRPSVRVAEGCV